MIVFRWLGMTARHTNSKPIALRSFPDACIIGFRSIRFRIRERLVPSLLLLPVLYPPDDSLAQARAAPLFVATRSPMHNSTPATITTYLHRLQPAGLHAPLTPSIIIWSVHVREVTAQRSSGISALPQRPRHSVITFTRMPGSRCRPEAESHFSYVRFTCRDSPKRVRNTPTKYSRATYYGPRL
jgi:hypothetical protein